jgi:hypothetical protein
MAGHVVDLMGKTASSSDVPEWVTCPREVQILSHYWSYVTEVLCQEVPGIEELQMQPVGY